MAIKTNTSICDFPYTHVPPFYSPTNSLYITLIFILFTQMQYSYSISLEPFRSNSFRHCLNEMMERKITQNVIWWIKEEN